MRKSLTAGLRLELTEGQTLYSGLLNDDLSGVAVTLGKPSTVLKYPRMISGRQVGPKRPQVCSEPQGPHSPIGRGSGLKIL